MLSILRSRTLRIAVLLFQAAWLNAVVPGHRRGVVGLPGERCDACRPQQDSCCPEMAEASPARPKAPSPGDPASHCAICHFAAALLAAAPIDLSPPPLEFLECLDRLPPERAAVALLELPYHGRAPPMSSFHLV